MVQSAKTKVLVIDNGSDTIKCGFVGEDTPSSIFPSVVGEIKDKQFGDTRTHLVGVEADGNRGMLKNFSSPI